MKRIIKITLIFMLFLLCIFCTKAFASGESLTVENIEVTAPDEGIYGVGQEITITVTFNKPVKGKMRNYKIYFGKDSSKTIELQGQELTEFSNVAEYKYTIKEGDNGELNPASFASVSDEEYDNYILEDEEGNNYNYIYGHIFQFEKTILADTTIEWTDFSNAKVKMYSEYLSKLRSIELKIENCNLIDESRSYYVHFSHLKDEDINVKKQEDIDPYGDGSVWQGHINPYYNEVVYAEKEEIFAEVGDVYITICEIDNATDVPKIVLKSQKIERLPELPLTKRLHADFLDDETSSFCYDNYSKNQKTINYKIGKVTDISLLKAIKNGQASALTDLMEYAKKADSIGTGSINLGEDNTITDKLNIVDDEYYYVYLQLDTVNGKYIEIEDVSLYQALCSERYGKNLLSYTASDFTWNFNEEEGFSDFSNAKATYGNMRVVTNLAGEKSEEYCNFQISNIIANTQKYHKFYFYISNSMQDLPEHDSELWKEVESFEINKDNGQCYIKTSNIIELPYLDKIDFEKDIYIYIYEVISDNEITTEKIEGNYKLGLNAKKIVLWDLEIEEPKVETEEVPKDETIATEKIPFAGNANIAISLIVVATIICIILKKKGQKYRDIV